MSGNAGPGFSSTRLRELEEKVREVRWGEARRTRAVEVLDRKLREARNTRTRVAGRAATNGREAALRAHDAHAERLRKLRATAGELAAEGKAVLAAARADLNAERRRLADLAARAPVSRTPIRSDATFANLPPDAVRLVAGHLGAADKARFGAASRLAREVTGNDARAAGALHDFLVAAIVEGRRAGEEMERFFARQTSLPSGQRILNTRYARTGFVATLEQSFGGIDVKIQATPAAMAVCLDGDCPVNAFWGVNRKGKPFAQYAVTPPHARSERIDAVVRAVRAAFPGATKQRSGF